MSILDTGLARYFSEKQLRALRRARVGIVGAGGLGSNVAMMLARSGVRHLTLADHDLVDASNLNRQAYFPSDVGKSKVLALSGHLLKLEPDMALVVHELPVTRNNALSLFADCPVVVEAADDAGVKAALYEVFAPVKEFYVTASGLAGFGGSGDRAMICRRPRKNVAAVGDFTVAVDADNPPFAPRVMQAAAMQADAVLAYILEHFTLGNYTY